MICRMNQQQREALLELIDAKIDNAITDDLITSKRHLEAEDMFHKVFQNEDSQEDLVEHVKRT